MSLLQMPTTRMKGGTGVKARASVGLVMTRARALLKVTLPRVRKMATREEASPRAAGEGIGTAVLTRQMVVEMKRMEKNVRIVINLNVADASMGLARDPVATMKIRAAGTSHPAAAGRATVPTTRLLTLTAARQRAKRAVAGELSRVAKTRAMARRMETARGAPSENAVSAIDPKLLPPNQR